MREISEMSMNLFIYGENGTNTIIPLPFATFIVLYSMVESLVATMVVWLDY